MSPPPVSVVIPAYNQAEFLAKTIQSVLDQTHHDFEIIIVNDCSTDDTEEVVAKFNDKRIRYVAHKNNLRLAAARNTGMRLSCGDIIALLDADDLFHPDKLQAHVDFLDKHPEIGVSYNSRFELNHSSDSIREIWRAPASVTLKDLILGFPFSPSDMVIRREWAFMVGLFDPEMGTAEDTDFPCRLALAGCRFAGIDRALNYRRYHSGRPRRNLPGRIGDVRRAQDSVFADERCPPELRALGQMAIKHHLMVIVSLAFIQEETELARKYFRELVELDPSVLEKTPCEFITFLLWNIIADESVDHELLLQRILTQIPDDFRWLSSQYDWAVARGWLWKGIRSIIWGRLEDGHAHFSRAVQLRASLDEKLIQLATSHLLAHQNEFGSDAVLRVLEDLKPCLDKVSWRGGHKMEGSYFVNRAFECYRLGHYVEARNNVLRALTRDFSCAANRGVLSVLVHSLAFSLRILDPGRKNAEGIPAAGGQK